MACAWHASHGRILAIILHLHCAPCLRLCLLWHSRSFRASRVAIDMEDFMMKIEYLAEQA